MNRIRSSMTHDAAPEAVTHAKDGAAGDDEPA
jgi:hypothetical protein